MMTRHVLRVLIALVTTAAAPAAALAEGAVRVECFGRCDLVNLGAICSTYAFGATPVALECVHPSAGGNGSNITCGSATCREWGSLLLTDPLSAYCDDVVGYDAIVTCRAPSGAAVREPAFKLPVFNTDDDAMTP